jgi:hypothetical protein
MNSDGHEGRGQQAGDAHVDDKNDVCAAHDLFRALANSKSSTREKDVNTAI